MSIKKKTLSLVVVVCILGATALLIALLETNKMNAGSVAQHKDSERRIITKNYVLVVPPNVTNLNQSPSDGAIELDYTQDYGTVKVDLFTSDLVIRDITSAGDVKRETVKVAGVTSQRIDSDYSKIVRQTSTKAILRYSVRFNQINLPSENQYTVFTIDLYTKSPASSSELAAFKAQVLYLINGLEIKK